MQFHSHVIDVSQSSVWRFTNAAVMHCVHRIGNAFSCASVVSSYSMFDYTLELNTNRTIATGNDAGTVWLMMCRLASSSSISCVHSQHAPASVTIMTSRCLILPPTTDTDRQRIRTKRNSKWLWNFSTIANGSVRLRVESYDHLCAFRDAISVGILFFGCCVVDVVMHRNMLAHCHAMQPQPRSRVIEATAFTDWRIVLSIMSDAWSSLWTALYGRFGASHKQNPWTHRYLIRN